MAERALHYGRLEALRTVTTVIGGTETAPQARIVVDGDFGTICLISLSFIIFRRSSEKEAWYARPENESKGHVTSWNPRTGAEEVQGKTYGSFS